MDLHKVRCNIAKDFFIRFYQFYQRWYSWYIGLTRVFRRWYIGQETFEAPIPDLFQNLLKRAVYYLFCVCVQFCAKHLLG